MNNKHYNSNKLNLKLKKDLQYKIEIDKDFYHVIKLEDIVVVL